MNAHSNAQSAATAKGAATASELILLREDLTAIIAASPF